jgi:4-amino-4-deoxy-L-arabinose transferase-like glycosyltransferase
LSAFFKEKHDHAAFHAVVILSCFWALMAFLAGPIGDFPLNDDWSYGAVVKSIVEKGSLHLCGWVSMPLIAQAAWGALFCLPHGFSFTSLRLSTLILGLVGILATYGLLREMKAGKNIAFLGAMLLATNPLYFVLSNTFMTDIPFTALSTLAFFLIFRGIRREDKIQFIAGWGFAFLAVFIRQLGIVLPLAYGIAVAARSRLKRNMWLPSLIPSAAIIGALFGYWVWLRWTGKLPHLYHAKEDELLRNLSSGLPDLFRQFSGRLAEGLTYLGLSSLPFLLLTFPHRWKSASPRSRHWMLIVCSCLICAILGVLFVQNHLMPFGRNVLFDLGLGPPTLRDVYILKLPNLPHGSKVLWTLITFMSLTGASLLILDLFSALRYLFFAQSRQGKDTHKSLLLLMLLSLAFLYFIPIGIAGIFDRYVVFLLPFSMSLNLVAGGLPESVKVERAHGVLTVALLMAYCSFSVGATHDYLAWNRSRWQALDYLTGQCGVSPKRIDGGFEFNGWHGYTPSFPSTGGSGKENKSWWWVEDDEYMISFGAVPGYEEMKRYTYQKWIPYCRDNMFILHRVPNFQLDSFLLK